MVKATKARTDADRTAKPRTRLVKKAPAGQCAGPGTHLGTVQYEDESGARTPLTKLNVGDLPPEMARGLLEEIVVECIRKGLPMMTSDEIFCAIMDTLEAANLNLEEIAPSDDD